MSGKRALLKVCFGSFYWLGPLVLCGAVGCTTTERPQLELVLAREAFSAATEVDSAKYAPSNYHRAEEAYHQAMTAYKNKDYKLAGKEFKIARTFSERAENVSRVQRQKAGEEGL